MTEEYLSPADFVAYVASRGYRADPLLNTLEVGANGAALRIVGYTLVGPRGNKTTVGKTITGHLPKFDAELWADGVDYASEKIAERRR